MVFTRSQLVLACTLASTLLVSACSKENSAQKQDTLTASTPATGEASTLNERNAQQRLISTLEKNFKAANINAKIVSIQKTEVPNLFWINLEGMGSVYATSDGQYIIQGDVIRLGDKQLHNVSEALQATENKKHLASLKNEDLIVYPAKGGKAKHIIYVFTDSSCPYCHRLHENIPAINEKGIEVRYIAWPRGDQFMPTMQAIWCSKDRKAAFDQAIQGLPVSAAECKNPVSEQYQLGLNMGVNGTPAIYNVDGEYLGGYMTADEIAQRLNK
ncbi:DsbC family protein [Acinetobacter halotolerans]|uniref:Thiol:disulfide interchange protein n=1 Tax=Acinetobacter halotolerans TaxID=1752076 RepID=A0A4Q6XFG8_9GAMM|nr:DsbC family protein [Acinetobacter halotolerans]RZF50018.1 DsbC family protein [Acinetobacter halotolerans]